MKTDADLIRFLAQSFSFAHNWSDGHHYYDEAGEVPIPDDLLPLFEKHGLLAEEAPLNYSRPPKPAGLGYYADERLRKSDLVMARVMREVQESYFEQAKRTAQIWEEFDKARKSGEGSVKFWFRND